MVMKGLTWSSLKKAPSLIPLFVAVGCGVTAGIVYTARVAIFNPEVSFNKKGNPQPWQAYANKQYKFYEPTAKPEDFKKPAPDY